MKSDRNRCAYPSLVPTLLLLLPISAWADWSQGVDIELNSLSEYWFVGLAISTFAIAIPWGSRLRPSCSAAVLRVVSALDGAWHAAGKRGPGCGPGTLPRRPCGAALGRQAPRQPSVGRRSLSGAEPESRRAQAVILPSAVEEYGIRDRRTGPGARACPSGAW